MLFPIRIRAGALIIEQNQILLAEFQDEKGLHYNLPAGGVEEGEGIKEAVRREVLEETGEEVEVGDLAFAYEYAPHLNENFYGETHALSLFFRCIRMSKSEEIIPQQPDPTQTGAKWISLSDLDSIVLYPKIQHQILEYARHSNTDIFIEETSLSK
ncbi:NUDIX domain-containing protein [Rossellomorea aquimaris]|uniref:NUDIX domain-containing protein n=1 Tax=Rossellomorea aquimaris TaxID=189382 RepID=UPI0007D04822|nr:NUDIX domain-containing protein [Rossellomorea aquimaris]